MKVKRWPVTGEELGRLYHGKGSLGKLRSYLEANYGFIASNVTIWNRLRKLGVISYAPGGRFKQRTEFSGTPIERAYQLGLSGDFNARPINDNTLRVRLGTPLLDYARLFERIFSPYGNVVVRACRWTNRWTGTVQYGWTSTVWLSRRGFKHLENGLTARDALLASKEELYAIMSGLADSEGHISIGSRDKTVCLGISSNNLSLLLALKKRLEDEGYFLTVKTGMEFLTKKQELHTNYQLLVRRRDQVVQLLRQLHLKHRLKAHRKDFLLANVVQGTRMSWRTLGPKADAMKEEEERQLVSSKMRARQEWFSGHSNPRDRMKRSSQVTNAIEITT